MNRPVTRAEVFERDQSQYTCPESISGVAEDHNKVHAIRRTLYIHRQVHFNLVGPTATTEAALETCQRFKDPVFSRGLGFTHHLSEASSSTCDTH